MKITKPNVLIEKRLEWLSDIIKQSNDIEDVLKKLGIENSSATRAAEHFISYVVGSDLEKTLSITRKKQLRERGANDLQLLNETMSIDFFLTANGVPRQQAAVIKHAFNHIEISTLDKLKEWIKTSNEERIKGLSENSKKILINLFIK